MRILIVNTSDRTGGAAVAASRLMDALNNNGEQAKMLVRDKETGCITVAQLPTHMPRKWNFLWERWNIFRRLRFSRNHLFEIDTASSGTDITSLPEYQWADVIHLNWINQGMLSLASIRKIIRSGKPVVWTMHDLWPATGICHYPRGCAAYKNKCGNCRLLPGGGSASDMSADTWKRKKTLYAGSNIYFVACSRWLEGQARQSTLLTGQRVTNIPNAIDTRVFNAKDKRESRLVAGLPEDKRVILFVSHKVTDKRKGMDYFIEAVTHLATQHPGIKDDTVGKINSLTSTEACCKARSE